MKKTLLFVLVLSILASCTTSNQVVSNKLFQKRKYQKGWHVNSVKKVDNVNKSEAIQHEEEIVAQNNTSEEKTEEKVKQNYETRTSNAKDDETAVAVETEKEEEVVSEEKISVVNSVKEKISSINLSVSSIKEQIQSTSQLKSETSKKMDESDSVYFILLLILCFVLPPLTVGLLRDWDSKEFLISLVLFLIGWGGIIAFGALGSLAVVAGIAYALLILFDVI